MQSETLESCTTRIGGSPISSSRGREFTEDHPLCELPSTLAPGRGEPVDAEWSGAEIRACCRLAAMLDLPLVEAALNVVPVAKTAAESVAQLRAWASGRCLSADQGGIYQDGGKLTTRRRVRRSDPSSN